MIDNKAELVRLTEERFQESVDWAGKIGFGVRCEIGSIATDWHDQYLVMRHEDPTIITVPKVAFHETLKGWFTEKIEPQKAGTRDFRQHFADTIQAVDALMSGDKTLIEQVQSKGQMRWPLNEPFNVYLSCGINLANKAYPYDGASWVIETDSYSLVSALRELAEREEKQG